MRGGYLNQLSLQTPLGFSIWRDVPIHEKGDEDAASIRKQLGNGPCEVEGKHWAKILTWYLPSSSMRCMLLRAHLRDGEMELRIIKTSETRDPEVVPDSGKGAKIGLGFKCCIDSDINI